VDKLRILKDFEELAFKESLGSDEIRLYLLLLANCDIAMHGELGYDTIRGALGKRFSPTRLNRACQRLSVHGLIEIIPPSLDEISKENFSLKYGILQLAAEQPH
jgi:hypothetical protein